MGTPRSPIPRLHHYVPQFLLKGFAFGKSDQVHVFEKPTQRTFTAAVKNVAAQRDFYSVERPSGVLTLEPSLAALETAVAAIIKRVRKDESLAGLTAQQRSDLAHFVVVQQQRTDNFRRLIKQFNIDVGDVFRERFGIDPDDVANYRPLTDEDVKTLSMQALEKAHDLAPLILDKAWLLFRAPSSHHFYISDNPVALQNLQPRGHFGNLGLAVRGIEIHLPISSRLSLAFVCQSYEEKARDAARRGPKIMALVPSARHKLSAGVARAQEFVRCIESGAPVDCAPDNMLNVNSLQVRYSERYIFSGKSDFLLAREMINAHPELRTGPRFEVG